MSFSAWFSRCSLHDMLWFLPAIISLLYVFSCPTSSTQLSGWEMHLVWATDYWCYMFIVSLIGVSSSILWWSMYYMGQSPESTHLHLNMAWFVGSMMVLLLMGSLVVGLVGWEGLGISSFYLVSFTRSRSSISGALITMITNRTGDIGYFIALATYILGSGIWLPFLMLLLASTTKSSQYPFSSWLPAAMAAPTPVSSLVHSSTLVTAGIYLMLRMGMGGFVSLAVLGVVTMVGGGFVAWRGQDAKKIVALSTLSQLGLMVYTLAVCSELLAFNHLLTHAYFKSLLFMCVGVLIHSCFGSQESRLSSDGVSPRGSIVIGAASVLSMMGLVATTGGGSKHVIIDSLGTWGGFISFGLFVVGSGLTILYSTKLLRSLGGYRVGYSATGASAVGSPGVGPLVVSLLVGVLFYFMSSLIIGANYMHHMSSPFFVCLIVSFILWGSSTSTSVSNGVWVGFSSGVGSFSFLAEVGKTTTLTDVKTASIVSGWMGANSALAALIGVASLLLFMAKHKQMLFS